MHRPDPIFRSYGVNRRRFDAMALRTTVIARPIGRLATTEAALAIGEMAAPEEPIEPQLAIDDTNTGKQAAHATEDTHTKGPRSRECLTDAFRDINFGALSKSAASHDPAALPKDGQMDVVLEYQGDRMFCASFPNQFMVGNSEICAGIGLGSSTGQVVGLGVLRAIPTDGEPRLSWKEGQSPIIRDLWSNVGKDHEFRARSTAQAQPASGTAGGNGDAGALAVVETGLSMFGTMLAFL